MWPVSLCSNKSRWICTLLLGRMQQCKSRGHLLATFYPLLHLWGCIWRFLSPFLFPLSVFFFCLWSSIEFMFVHSNGGQGWPSKPHPLRPHRIWDNHCRSCCQDSQNTTSRRHHGGEAVRVYWSHGWEQMAAYIWFDSSYNNTHHRTVKFVLPY